MNPTPQGKCRLFGGVHAQAFHQRLGIGEIEAGRTEHFGGDRRPHHGRQRPPWRIMLDRARAEQSQRRNPGSGGEVHQPRIIADEEGAPRQARAQAVAGRVGQRHAAARIPVRRRSRRCAGVPDGGLLGAGNGERRRR